MSNDHGVSKCNLQERRKKEEKEIEGLGQERTEKKRGKYACEKVAKKTYERCHEINEIERDHS